MQQFVPACFGASGNSVLVILKNCLVQEEKKYFPVFYCLDHCKHLSIFRTHFSATIKNYCFDAFLLWLCLECGLADVEQGQGRQQSYSIWKYKEPVKSSILPSAYPYITLWCSLLKGCWMDFSTTFNKRYLHSLKSTLLWRVSRYSILTVLSRRKEINLPSTG